MQSKDRRGEPGPEFQAKEGDHQLEHQRTEQNVEGEVMQMMREIAGRPEAEIDEHRQITHR